MKVKRRKLRIKRIIICFMILISIPILASLTIIKINKFNIKYNKNVKIEINSNMYNLDNIKQIKHGKIITKRKKINASKLGTKKISIKVKPKFDSIKTYSYNVKVVDTTKPVIKCKDSIDISLGSNEELITNIDVEDNSKEKINIDINGEYDLNKVGKYDIEYIAKDSSGNTAKKKVTINVTTVSNEVATQNAEEQLNTEHKIIEKDGITYVDGIMIVNKTYSLPSTYNPGGLTSETMDAFNKMAADAKTMGLHLFVASGFRSYDTQNALYNKYVAKDGKQSADTYSARPGHSEHQSGLAFDLNLVDISFENTNEGKWLNENCYRFGFILRFPKGKTAETGYIYEPWHFRYVGVDLATKLYNNGNWISLEKYFGLTSEYNY